MFSGSLLLSCAWLFFRIFRVVEVVGAFSPYPWKQQQQQHGSRWIGDATHTTVASQCSRPATGLWNNAPKTNEVEDFDDWTDERRDNLFRFLLRDLEVEGVPLLACDGVAANKTLQGATWTVAGQLSANDYEQKVCLVLEDIPVEDLKAFVDLVSRIQARPEVVDSLPDLRRFSLSLLGNGIGPALIVETQNRTIAEAEEYESMLTNTPEPNELSWKASMESFVKRCFPATLGAADQQNNVAYRCLGSSDVCDVLAGYWNCVCEHEAAGESGADSIVLSCPPVSSGTEYDETRGGYARFLALFELIHAMNAEYKSDYDYDLIHLHPSYDRDEKISSEDRTNGHLPSTTSSLLFSEEDGETTSLTEEQLRLQNYQRRSPLPGVIIRRVRKGSETEKAELEYQNVLRLVQDGEEKLKEDHTEELKQVR
mmetsp:Transcript_27136/g.56137  ORF Transcript_27136/g.56137 Transcript_27136/m.56137 type:complete len:426 (+) Transcript_27136:255-1532(+)